MRAVGRTARTDECYSSEGRVFKRFASLLATEYQVELESESLYPNPESYLDHARP